MKKINYRLGLDLGTNSIGWAVTEIDKVGTPVKFIDGNSRIFTDGRHPKTGTSNAVARRVARGMRRNRDRKLQRMENMQTLLVRNNIFPITSEEKESLKLLNPYDLRTKLLEKELLPYELGRVLLFLAKRRGYKSNRKAAEANDSVFNTTLSEFESEIDKSAHESLGSFLNSRTEKRNLNGKMHPTRKLYELEFDLIKERQSIYFKNLSEKFWADAKHIIFFQRPLKDCIDLVGPCRLIPKESRAAKYLPCFQTFRIVDTISNLRLSKSGKPIELTYEQKHLIYEKMSLSKKITFSSLYKLLKIEDDVRFNFDTNDRKDLLGDEINSTFKGKKYFHGKWLNLNISQRNDIIKMIAETEHREDLYNYLCGLNLSISDEQIANICDYDINKLPSGYCNFSELALTQLNETMINDRYSDLAYAVKKIGFKTNDELSSSKVDFLEYYGKVLEKEVTKRPSKKHEEHKSEEEIYGKIGNPTVHIGLNQLRKVINRIIEKFGKPAEITIELARDLKLNEKQKKRVNAQNKENKKHNEDLQKLIDESKINISEASRADRVRYKLHKEQNGICPYTGKTISLSQLFSQEIHIDHLIPMADSLDDGYMNKIICFGSANEDKGNKTPFEYLGADQEMYARIKDYPFGKKARFDADARDKFANSDKWLARQLNETRYLSKMAKKYLSTICEAKNIHSSNGSLTHILRHSLGLNNLFEGQKGKRDDHRHHAVDALVLSLMGPRVLLKFRTLASKHNPSSDKKLWSYVIDNMKEFKTFRSQALDNLTPKLVSHRLRHKKQGSFFDDTAYGILNNPVEIDGKTYSLTLRCDPQSLNSKKYELIIDRKIRQSFIDIRESSVSDGKVNDKVLADKVKILCQKENIKKVKTYINKSSFVKISHPIDKRFSKGLLPDELSHLIVWDVPGKDGSENYYDFQGVYIYEYQMNKDNLNNLRKHHNAKKVMTIFKGDIVATKDDVKYKVKSISPSKSNMHITCVDINQEGSKPLYLFFNKFKEKELRLVYPSELGITVGQ